MIFHSSKESNLRVIYSLIVTVGSVEHYCSWIDYIARSAQFDSRHRNYAKLDYAKRLFYSRKIGAREYLRLRKEALKGTKAEWGWARAKAKELIKRAIEMGEDLRAYGYWRCPMCSIIMKLSLANKTINHIVGHGIEIESIIITQTTY